LTEKILKQAKIIFSKSLGKYTAISNGKVIAKSGSQEYLAGRILQLGYILENVVSASPNAPKVDEFGINQRFDFVRQMVGMVASKTIASAVITGQGGLGKTHTVLRELESTGMTNVTDLAAFEVGTKIKSTNAYRIIKGFSTAKGLYRALFEGNGMVLVFDDCDSVLKDPVALNLLKGALDSYSERYISWNADIRDEDLPRSFKFDGAVIFISNMDLETIDQAVRTRALCVDVSMTEEQKVERMQVIIKDEDFMPEIDLAVKKEALDFIQSILKSINNLSLRSLIATIKIRSKGGDWKSLAKYVLTQGA
jgi:hypothetical protein